MNLNRLTHIVQRMTEFVEYMQMFYSKEHGGVYAAETDFTVEEIVAGIDEYIKDDAVLAEILQHGADTVDRERVRAIIEQARQGATA